MLVDGCIGTVELESLSPRVELLGGRHIFKMLFDGLDEAMALKIFKDQ